MTLKIFEVKPGNFDTSVEVSACYVQVDQKFLLLQKPDSNENTWSVPGGKIERGETPLQAAKRELFEETGIETDQIRSLTKLYVRKPGVDFVYHMFQVNLGVMPLVAISKEHQSYTWKEQSQLDQLPLIAGFHEALEYYTLYQK